MNMANRFVQADSSNLPEVNTLMILEYVISSKKHSIDEIRDVKKLAASDENYVIDAVGFVQLKNNGTGCLVKAKVASEEEGEIKYHTVSVHVQDNTITDSTCDCHPDLGGRCKNTFLFLCWLRNKSSIPERAPVQCFWHKPLLGTNYSLRAEDIFKFAPKRGSIELQPRDPNVLKNFIEECKERNITNSLTLHYSSPQ